VVALKPWAVPGATGYLDLAAGIATQSDVCRSVHRLEIKEMMLTVNPTMNISNFDDLLRAARAQPEPRAAPVRLTPGELPPTTGSPSSARALRRT
jgi:hypothetical protein